MKKPSCAKRHSVLFNREVRATINSAVGAATGTPVRDYFETPNSFCSSPLLHRYLTKMGYTVHPCEEFRASRQHNGECDIFLYTSPPANEVNLNFFLFIFFYLFSDTIYFSNLLFVAVILYLRVVRLNVTTL